LQGGGPKRGAGRGGRRRGGREKPLKGNGGEITFGGEGLVSSSGWPTKMKRGNTEPSAAINFIFYKGSVVGGGEEKREKHPCIGRLEGGSMKRPYFGPGRKRMKRGLSGTSGTTVIRGVAGFGGGEKKAEIPLWGKSWGEGRPGGV